MRARYFVLLGALAAAIIVAVVAVERFNGFSTREEPGATERFLARAGRRRRSRHMEIGPLHPPAETTDAGTDRRNESPQPEESSGDQRRTRRSTVPLRRGSGTDTIRYNASSLTGELMSRLSMLITSIALSGAMVFAHEGNEHVRGVVTQVSPQSITVQTTDKKTRTLTLTTKTTFQQAGKAARLADLKVGDR